MSPAQKEAYLSMILSPEDQAEFLRLVELEDRAFAVAWNARRNRWAAYRKFSAAKQIRKRPKKEPELDDGSQYA